MIIGSDIEDDAIGNGAKLAIACGREELLWCDLPALANRVSNWLVKETPPGAGIAILLPNCAALPIIVLAIARAGRIAQVLDPSWPDATVRKTCDVINSALLITSQDRELSIAGSFPISPETSLASLQDLVSGYSPVYRSQINPALPFYIGFTSGSTGLPKGYRRTHESWTRSFNAEAKEFGHTKTDVISAPGSLSHSLFLYAVMHALHIGATAIMHVQFRPAALLKSMEHYGVSLLYAVPAQLKLLTSVQPEAAFKACQPLRRVIVSGSKWADDDRTATRRLFPGAKLAEFYGASELSFVSVSKEEDNVPAGSVGRAFPGVDISIMDDNGRVLSARDRGQIFVRSAMVFDAYAGDENASELSRIGDFVSVGDMGYLDNDGFLFLSGRRDRMIVSSGKNLFPEEIELALQLHPDVTTAAVVSLPDDIRGSRIVAVVSAQDGIGLTSTALIAYLRDKLPLYKVPRRYFTISDWPLTRSGKTDFAAVAQRLASHQYQPLP